MPGGSWRESPREIPMSGGPRRWRRLSSSVEDDHGIFKVRKDVSVSPRTGEAHEFIVLDSRDWVLVVPILADGRLVMIRQYRHGLADLTLEVPAAWWKMGSARKKRGEKSCVRRPAMAAVSYTHLRAHETDSYLVCRLLLEKKKK